MTKASRPILVFDSGVGGLTVLAEIHKALPDASTVFAADTAGFPYGALTAEALQARVLDVIGRLIARFDPVLVVVACNTVSTLVLPALRARHAIPFVGTVPAIKPAAALTCSGLISVLATPGTVKRDYTRELIHDFAANCDVTLVGSPRLASIAEAHLRGEAVNDEELGAEIAPCFVEREGARTDVIVLACTHYPLLLPAFERLAPWSVTWLDPAPAIARRVHDVLPATDGAGGGRHVAIVTSNGPGLGALAPAFARFGLAETELLPMPLASTLA
jgi:glutamate racemase